MEVESFAATAAADAEEDDDATASATGWCASHLSHQRWCVDLCSSEQRNHDNGIYTETHI